MSNIELPKKDLYAVNKIDIPPIITQDGKELPIRVPNTIDLRAAWIVLKKYIEDNTPNEELGDVNNIISSHYREQGGYCVYVAEDKKNKVAFPVAVASTEIIPFSEGNGTKRTLLFIYKVGVNSEVSKNYTNLDVVEQFYNTLSSKLPEISVYKCLGIITESRMESSELEAIARVGFKEFVPRDKTTKGSVLLANRDFILENHLEVQLRVAELYKERKSILYR